MLPFRKRRVAEMVTNQFAQRRQAISADGADARKGTACKPFVRGLLLVSVLRADIVN